MPEEQNVESNSEPVQQDLVEEKEKCWNCGSLLDDEQCDACGFDRSLVYNLELESKKERERDEAYS